MVDRSRCFRPMLEARPNFAIKSRLIVAQLSHDMIIVHVSYTRLSFPR